MSDEQPPAQPPAAGPLTSGEGEGGPPSRPERREEKRRRQRARVAKHGAGLRRVYRDAVLKRAGKKGTPAPEK